MRRFFGLVLLLAALLWTGAGRAADFIPPFPVEERRIDETSDDPRAEIHAAYPQFAGAPAAVNAEIAAAARTLLADFRHNLDPEAYHVRPSTARLGWRITYASPDLLGVRLEAELTFGNVRRPSADIRNLVFDLKTGRRLAPVDLFQRLSQAQGAVARHCLAALEEAARRRNLRLEDIADEGWVRLVLAGPWAWGLTADGFVISFNLGNQLGVEEVALPFDVVRPYLRPELAVLLHGPV